MLASAAVVTVALTLASEATVHRDKTTPASLGKPGIKVKITQKFINSIAPMIPAAAELYFTEEMGKCLKGVEKSLSVDGSLDNVWVIDDVQITAHQKTNLTVTLQQPSNFDVTSTGGHFAFVIVGHKKSNPDQSGKATMDITVINDHIVLGYKLVDNKVKLELETCDINRAVATTFNSNPPDEKAAAFYENLKTQANQMFCQAIRGFLNELNGDVNVEDSDTLISDLSFTELPVVSNNSIEFSMLGCSRCANGSNTTVCLDLDNFNPADLPEKLENDTQAISWMEADERQNQLMRLALKKRLLSRPYKLPKEMGGDLLKEMAVKFSANNSDVKLFDTDKLEVFVDFESSPRMQFVSHADKTEEVLEMEPILTFVVEREAAPKNSSGKFKVHVSIRQISWLESNSNGTLVLNEKGKPVVRSEGSIDPNTFSIEKLEGSSNLTEQQLQSIKQELLESQNKTWPLLTKIYEMVLKKVMPKRAAKREWFFQMLKALGAKNFSYRTYDNVIVTDVDIGEVHVQEGARLLLKSMGTSCANNAQHRATRHGVRNKARNN